MRLEFKPQAFEDLRYWVEFQPKLAKRILRMIEETQKDPFSGIGEAEPLRGDLSGCWSKRIDAEHRLIYKATSEALVIVQCRFHYQQ